jgi:hypothetical protein
MPTYSIAAPDGNTYKIEGPAGASQDQVVSEVLKQHPTAGNSPEKGNMYTQSAEDIQYSPEGIPLNTSSYGSAPTGATKSAQQALTSTVSLPVNVATGIAKSPAALVQMYDKYIGGGKNGDNMVNAINQIEKGTQAQMGDVGSAVNQVSSAVGQAAPYMGMGTTGMIPSFAQKIAQGAGMGALSGALTPEKTNLSPEEFKNAKAQNIGIQSTLGAAFPVVGGMLKTGYNAGKALIEPLYTGGREKIIGRALREYAGNEAEKAVANLKAAKELVSGSMPTVGEAAGVPSLAAAQRAATAVSQEATNTMAARQAANNEARAIALNQLAGTESERAALNLARENAAEDLYKTAFGKKMTLNPELTKEVNQLVQTPAIKDAMKQAQINAKNLGIDIKNPKGSIQGLHQTKLAIDDAIDRLKKPDMSSAEKNKMAGLLAAKDRLVGFLENKNISPEYKVARETYAAMSKPINEMDVIQGIANKAINPLNEKVYAGKFAQNLENIAPNTVSLEKLNALNAIKQDLARSQFAENAGRGIGSDTIQKLAYGNMLNQINLPNLLRRRGLAETAGNLMARASDVVYGKANKELANQFAETLLNPQQAASYMEIAKNIPKGTKMTAKTAKEMERANLAKMLLMQSAGTAAE